MKKTTATISNRNKLKNNKMAKKQQIQIATCNYCFTQIDYTIELENFQIPICSKPDCPAFALLQINQEKMIEMIGDEADREYYEGFGYRKKTIKINE
jgi:hypothetical protein